MNVKERGYLEDPYKCEFKARVLNVEDAGDGRCTVRLDRTYFYPTSGGQPNDTGKIGGSTVVDVIEDGGVVKHIVEGAVEAGEEVECSIDWERRFDHMQQHTGQHVLSRVFADELSMETVGFHLGRSVSTIDLDAPSLSGEEIERVEFEANKLIWRDIPIESRLMSREEFDRLCRDDGGALLERLRSKLPPEEKTVRLVEIRGCDISTCCGTHLEATGEIGLVKLIGTEKIRESVRVEFLCGQRALCDYMGKHLVLTELSRTFSTDWQNVAQSTKRLIEENREMRKAKEEASRELARSRALKTLGEPERLGDFELFTDILEEADASSLKESAFAIREQGARIVLMGAVKPKPFVVFACSAGAPFDMGRIMKEALEDFKGRGGGGMDYAQGGGISASDVRNVIERAIEILKESV